MRSAGVGTGMWLGTFVSKYLIFCRNSNPKGDGQLCGAMKVEGNGHNSGQRPVVASGSASVGAR